MTTAAITASERDDPSASSSYTRRVGSGMLYKLLSNPIYIGKLKHRQNVYCGEQQPIVDADLFHEVQRLIASQAATPRGSTAHADVHLLTGLLVDDTGDRMSPTHAKAHGKRYRYYISSRIKGAKRVDNTAWRIAAPELESAVVRFAIKLLTDQSLLAGWIGVYAPSADLKQCLDQASALRDKFANGTSANQRAFFQDILQSIALGSEAVTFAIKASALATMLQTGQSTSVAPPDDGVRPDPLISIKLPITIRRRSNEMRLIIQGDDYGRSPSRQLVNLVARAHLYLKHLTRQPSTSVGDVAREFGVHRVDVGRILPLAFLAPRAVDLILAGNQAERLSARTLARTNLPHLWNEQLPEIS